ncbi:MAG: hypothetical protein OXU45_00690, partial [Candidatus Melainabacteria bacterium]|nr:hypothetical protein [Candidatus Melainabacteria bacterium]
MRLRNLALVLFTCLSLNPSFALISPLDFVTRNDFGLVDDLTDIVVRNEYAYLTSNSFLNQGGLAVFDVSDPSEIKISEAIRDSDDAFNIVFVSNTAYVGQSDAFSVYDVTDPTSVVELGKAMRSGSQLSNLYGTEKVASSGTKVYAAAT